MAKKNYDPNDPLISTICEEVADNMSPHAKSMMKWLAGTTTVCVIAAFALVASVDNNDTAPTLNNAGMTTMPFPDGHHKGDGQKDSIPALLPGN